MYTARRKGIGPGAIPARFLIGRHTASEKAAKCLGRLYEIDGNSFFAGVDTLKGAHRQVRRDRLREHHGGFTLRTATANHDARSAFLAALPSVATPPDPAFGVA
jgi:hypothetical protein